MRQAPIPRRLHGKQPAKAEGYVQSHGRCASRHLQQQKKEKTVNPPKVQKSSWHCIEACRHAVNAPHKQLNIRRPFSRQFSITGRMVVKLTSRHVSLRITWKLLLSLGVLVQLQKRDLVTSTQKETNILKSLSNLRSNEQEDSSGACSRKPALRAKLQTPGCRLPCKNVAAQTLLVNLQENFGGHPP